MSVRYVREERDGTTWPVDDGQPDYLGWRLRYGNPEDLSRSDLLALASIVDAYAFLTSPHRTMKESTASLRRARRAAGREVTDR